MSKKNSRAIKPVPPFSLLLCIHHRLPAFRPASVSPNHHRRRRLRRYPRLPSPRLSVAVRVPAMPRGPRKRRREPSPAPVAVAGERKLLPGELVEVSDASYGLCVDALVEGSYWEGVIADHAEGSMERKVLFPDEGDERIMAIDQLRITQDWDEVTGKWKPRGMWLFLQMLFAYEEKDGLPLSVRQIWYDLRSDPSLMTEANLWMCGTKSFWERSLAVLIAELWSVCGRPLQDGYHSCRSAQAVTSADFQNKKVEPTVLDKLDSTPADISQTMSEFISYYRSNDRIGARAKREPIKRHLKSLGWTFVEDRPKNKYCVSPDGKRFISLIGACEAYLAQKGTKNNRQDCHTDSLVLHSVTRKNEDYNPTGMDLSLRERKSYNKLSTDASASWKPEQLNAELSPLIGSLLASYQEVTTFSQGHFKETMRTKLKKHLLALGWSIEFKLDEIRRHNDSLHVRLKKKYSDMESDSICSICNEGGDILLCDSCPSSFHHACVGLEATPKGSWYCPPCRCSICDSGDYDPDTDQFTEKTIMYCDQCESEYHVGCIRNEGDQLTCCPEGCWFCSRGCSEIFQHLQELIGKPIPTPVEGLSCTILKFDRENTSDDVNFDNEKMAAQYGKLCIALDVLHECFVTIIEPRTQRDISEDIVFNRESELRRLNFRGFYTILLQKDGELISVGTFRICGKKFAELPLIGTRVQYRRQGMCRLIMNELEKLLSGWGVERLILPAVPQLLETWTGSFGFTAMSNSDRIELAESSVLSFQGTTMCQKILNAVGHNPKDMSIQLVLNAQQMELGKNSIVSFERTTTSDTIVNNALNHSEDLNVTALTNYNSLELTENSIFSSWGTTIYQKVSSSAFSHPEGFEYQLECSNIVHEILGSDSQESTSVVMEDTDRLEPELLLEIRSNSGEEDICDIDVPTSTPNLEVGFTVEAHGQPYGSLGADQRNENCVLTEDKPVAVRTLHIWKKRIRD
uniref:Uncharacterized protein n=1 Tax=Avena sativa TaxID=4498 RepID=A0ACD5YQ14_AVESA